MSTIELLLIGGLATYALARMIAIEEGFGIPLGDKEEQQYGLFDRIRNKVDPKQQTWVGRGIRCPICISLWVGIPVMLGLFFTSWGIYPILILAIKGIVTLLYMGERKK